MGRFLCSGKNVLHKNCNSFTICSVKREWKIMSVGNKFIYICMCIAVTSVGNAADCYETSCPTAIANSKKPSNCATVSSTAVCYASTTGSYGIMWNL